MPHSTREAFAEMSSTHIHLVSTSMATRDARGVVYVGLAFVVHCLIWASIPPAFALAISAALILMERLAGELADSIIGAIAATDSRMTEHLSSGNAANFYHQLKLELIGPAASIGLATLAAIIGAVLTPWFAAVL